MHRIDGPGHDNNQFTEGDPQQGIDATTVTAEWANAVQEELVHIVEEAGLTPTEGQWDQVLDALTQIVPGALDRQADCLLHMPLINSLDILQGVGVASFARASTATYIDRYGVLRTAAVDEPRFEAEDHLSEEESTNQQVHSRDFGNAAWSKFGVTVSSGATAGPDGVAGSADKLVEDGSTGGHTIGDAPAAEPADNTLATVSADAKAAERTWLRLRIRSKDGVQHSAWFDISAGVVGSTQAGIVRARIRPLADGWYRCEASADAASGGTAMDWVIALADADGSSAYTGDGSSGCYIDNAQWENQPFATSTIPTGASAVTRAEDVLEVTRDGNAPWELASHTVLADVRLIGFREGSAQQQVVDFRNTSGTPWWALVARYNGDQAFYYNTNSSGSFGPLTPHAVHRIGGRYDKAATELSGWLDGVKAASNGAASPDPNARPETMRIGRNLCGHISNLRIYSRALSDREMVVA